MKKYFLFILAYLCSCSKPANKIDLYFNSTSLITKEFKLQVFSNKKVILDTVLNQTLVDKYRKIKTFMLDKDDTFVIIVNDLDSTLRNELNYSKLFVEYDDGYLLPERTEKENDVSEQFTLDKKQHRLLLEFKK